MDLCHFFTTSSLIFFFNLESINEKPDSYLSCVVVHRSTSSSHHEFLQAKLEKCSGLYESYFNPVSSPESVFRGTCH